jgi:hypothetical protein
MKFGDRSRYGLWRHRQHSSEQALRKLEARPCGFDAPTKQEPGNPSNCRATNVEALRGAAIGLFDA